MSNTEEDSEDENYKIEHHVDLREILSDFKEYLEEPVDEKENKGARLNVNSIHMFLSAVTAGGYLVGYWLYHFYRFYSQQQDGKYEYTKKIEIVE